MANLKEVEENNNGFPWGKVVKIHYFGSYQFVEYKEYKYNNEYPQSRTVSDNTHFSIYIDEKSISMSADTLEKAIVYAMAYKYDGLNSQAASFFFKMINLK